MSELTLPSGLKVFYEYDAIQDMLYMLFKQPIGATYYEDIVGSPGVMVRHDGTTDEVVGITVHNVQSKLMQRLIRDIGDQVLPQVA